MSFQNFNDREDVLRRAKLIRGLDGGGGRAYVKPMGIQSEPQVSNLHIIEKKRYIVLSAAQCSQVIKIFNMCILCTSCHKTLTDP